MLDPGLSSDYFPSFNYQLRSTFNCNLHFSIIKITDFPDDLKIIAIQYILKKCPSMLSKISWLNISYWKCEDRKIISSRYHLKRREKHKIRGSTIHHMLWFLIPRGCLTNPNFHLQPISKSRWDQFDVLVSHSNIYQMIYPPLFPTSGTQRHNWSCSHYYWQCLSITWSVNITATELLGSMAVWSLAIFFTLWRMPWARGLNMRIIIC